jgi:hypothetical protein
VYGSRARGLGERETRVYWGKRGRRGRRSMGYGDKRNRMIK